MFGSFASVMRRFFVGSARGVRVAAAGLALVAGGAASASAQE